MHQGGAPCVRLPLLPTTAQTAQAAACSVTRGIDPQLTRGTRGGEVSPGAAAGSSARAARGREGIRLALQPGRHSGSRSDGAGYRAPGPARASGPARADPAAAAPVRARLAAGLRDPG